MRRTPIPVQLRVGVAAGFTVAVLCVVYATVLAIGLATLPSPDRPIHDPWFTMMEVLILAIAPGMVAFTVGLHAWASAEHKPLALLSVLFMSMCAVITCCVHFALLTLSRHPAYAGPEWSSLIFSFSWPSVAYALDILAWDLFFPLAAVFAAFAVRGSGRASLVRALLLGSAALAFIGLAGVPLANMSIRNIGIIGYVVVFPIATVLLALMFRSREAQSVKEPLAAFRL
jgi:hypothetical protein